MDFGRILGAIAIATLCSMGAARAQDTGLGVELNKVEPADGGGCRAFFLFRNRTPDTLDAFEMSLAVLNQAAVIDRLLTIDAAPLPAGRTTLKLFEIPDTACGDISEILLHDIPACRTAGGDEGDCFATLTLSSRADVALSQ